MKKLKTVINELEKGRQKFIKEFGKEPTVHDIENDFNSELIISVCGSTKKKERHREFYETSEIIINL